jgi:ArsR family transcriptional regulator
MREDPALNTNSAAPAKPRGSKAGARGAPVIAMSDATLADLTDVFKLLADKNRMKILIALAQDGEMHVSALCQMLGQSQPAVSHHLTLMRAHKLVGYRRAGKHNFYRLECGHLRDLLDQVFANYGNGHKQIQFHDFALAYKRGK